MPFFHLQAWFNADLRGKKHNWFDLDCGPVRDGKRL